MADDKKRGEDYTIEMEKTRDGNFDPPPAAFKAPVPQAPDWTSHPLVPILSYCGSSIMMTVLNKFVLLGDFNLNFFLLAVQVRTAPSRSENRTDAE